MSIVYSPEIHTYQVSGPGADAAAALMTPVMAVGVAIVLLLGIRAMRRGAAFGRLLPALALSFVVVLMLANKVGSPQFVTWLAAPIILGLVLRPYRFMVPAVLAAAIALVTHAFYPYLYGWLLAAHPAFVLLVTVKAGLLAALLVWGIRAVWQAGAVRARPGIERGLAPRANGARIGPRGLEWTCWWHSPSRRAAPDGRTGPCTTRSRRR